MKYVLMYHTRETETCGEGAFVLCEAGHPAEIATLEEALKFRDSLGAACLAGEGGWPYPDLVETWGNNPPPIDRVWIGVIIEMADTVVGVGK